MEGTGYRRCKVAEAQGQHEDKIGDEEGQDFESLRQPLWLANSPS